MVVVIVVGRIIEQLLYIIMTFHVIFVQTECSGSDKKARTFDFMAMFQEARQTAIERTQTSRGNFVLSNIKVQV